MTVLVPPEPVSRSLRQATSVAWACVTTTPAKIHFLSRRPFREKVRRTLARERFDLLVINGSDLLWCLDEAPPGMTSLAVVHNSESQLYADQVATVAPGAARRAKAL